jgi:glycosyltransferase involved in cell wall biosynthesis
MSEENNIEYSVVIPAYNEEELLLRTLVHLKKAMEMQKQKGEIIVVDNNSTDRTPAIAQKEGVKLTFEPFRQISRARNAGARSAHGKFLIFLDADTIMSNQLLTTALNNLINGTHCGGGTLIHFDTPLPFFAGKLVFFWNWLSKAQNLAAGSFVYCLSEGFQAIGGFSEKIYASEEIFFSRQLSAWGKTKGLKFSIIPNYPVITSSRKFHWFSSLQIALLLSLLTVFPWALRNRRLCGFWYNRPEN